MFKVIALVAIIGSALMCAIAEIIGSIAHPLYNQLAAIMSTYQAYVWYGALHILLVVIACICAAIDEMRGK